MEFRGQDDGMGYNPPPPIRPSAFSKPTLSPSSSLLLSPRAVSSAAASGRNGNCFDPSSSSPSPGASSAPNPSSDPTRSSAPLPISPSGATITNSRPSTSPQSASMRASTSSTPSPTSSHGRYRECLRNHAASIGGHVVDGCGEFMPGGAGDSGVPDAMKCAACGCHRSFHRKDSDADSYYHRFGSGGGQVSSVNCTRGGGGSGSRVPLLLPPPPPNTHHHSHQNKPPFAPVFPPSSPSGVVPGSSATESSSEELNAGSMEVAARHAAVAAPLGAPKKRFRTKFTTEQKEKMLAFAERVGWRLQRQDDAAVEQFCAEAGVKRQVLKVWMHNNKHTYRRHQLQQQQQQQQQQEPQQQQQQQQ